MTLRDWVRQQAGSYGKPHSASYSDLASARVSAIASGLLKLQRHSSAFGSMLGNSTSMKPKRLKSVMREGYRRPIR
jgi:hypothetical protein